MVIDVGIILVLEVKDMGGFTSLLDQLDQQ